MEPVSILGLSQRCSCHKATLHAQLLTPALPVSSLVGMMTTAGAWCMQHTGLCHVPHSCSCAAWGLLQAAAVSGQQAATLDDAFTVPTRVDTGSALTVQLVASHPPQQASVAADSVASPSTQPTFTWPDVLRRPPTILALLPAMHGPVCCLHRLCLQDLPCSGRRRVLHCCSQHTHVNRLQHLDAQKQQDPAAVSQL
jgi:hypothetical protein